MQKQLFYVRQLLSVLWLRATLAGAAAVVAAAVAVWAGPLAPSGLAEGVSAEAVSEILTILASSMLVVATFSVATMVAAAAAVTGSASPRASALMLDDRKAQNAISAFIGAFIFSIVGLTAAGLSPVEQGVRFFLFAETLVVIVVVIVTLLRWVDHLTGLVKVGKAVDRVEHATLMALEGRRPFLGGVPAVEPPAKARAMYGATVGYVQDVDTARLQRLAEKNDLRLHVRVLPGSFVRPTRPILIVEGAVDERVLKQLLDALVIGGSRTFQQDPRYGLVVLAEIASRALSPAVNDPGTAIDVVGTAVRVLSLWAGQHWDEQASTHCPRVFVPGLSAADLFDDVFRPIERDGAAMIEVGIALQKAFIDLTQLSASGFSEAACGHSSRALRRAEPELPLKEDRVELRNLADQVRAAAAPWTSK